MRNFVLIIVLTFNSIMSFNITFAQISASSTDKLINKSGSYLVANISLDEKENVLKILKLDLDADGKDVNELINSNGQTQLHLASITADLKLINILLNNGADTNIVDKDGMLAIDYAVMSGALPIIKILIASNSEITNKRYSNVSELYPPYIGTIKTAMKLGDYETFKWFLKNDYKLTFDINGDHDLMISSLEKWDVELVALLLEYNYSDIKQWAEAAIFLGDEASFNLIINHHPTIMSDPLFLKYAFSRAIDYGYLEGVNFLLQRGISSSEPLSRQPKMTPLIFALYYSHGDIIKTLHAHGADPLSTENQSKRFLNMESEDFALLIGLITGDDTIIEQAQIEGGVVIRQADNNLMEKRAHLLFGSLSDLNILEQKVSIRKIIDIGLDVNEDFGNGFTPLMSTAWTGGDGSLITTLIEFGADVYQRGYKGRTAVDMARSLKVAEALLVHGALPPPSLRPHMRNYELNVKKQYNALFEKYRNIKPKSLQMN